jgi:nicotinate-nucleotide pyrophosphorylase (carboxylating)
MMDWNGDEITSILSQALTEDLGDGDITGATVAPPDLQGIAVFLARESGVMAGFPLANRIFSRLDPRCRVQQYCDEGGFFETGAILGSVEGPARALLAGERVSLNFLQRLCGIATRTAAYVKIAALHGIRILDTRKTTPLLRALEKYAVRMGGGTNHRMGLYDAPMVKDNHLQIQPDFGAVLDAFRGRGIAPEEVEIEVTTPEMLAQAIAAGACWLLLDNMSPEQVRRCVALKRIGMKFEVSGGVTLENLSEYMIEGVDFISIGALTHSVKSLDISLEMR